MNVRSQSWVNFSDEEEAENEMFENNNYSYPLGNEDVQVQPHIPQPISTVPYNPSDETPMLSPLINVSSKMKNSSVTPPSIITPTEQQHPIVEPPMVTPENKISKATHSNQPDSKDQQLLLQQQQQFLSPSTASSSSSNYVDNNYESATEDGQFSYVASDASPRRSTNPYSPMNLGFEPITAPVKPVSVSANHSETDLATLGVASPTGSVVDVTAIAHDVGNVTTVSHVGINDTAIPVIENEVNEDAVVGSQVNLKNFGQFEYPSRRPHPDFTEIDERDAILRVDTSTTTKDHYAGFDSAGKFAVAANDEDEDDEDSEFPTAVVTSTTPLFLTHGIKSVGCDDIPRQPSIAQLDEGLMVSNYVGSSDASESAIPRSIESSVTPVFEEKEEAAVVPLKKDVDTPKPAQYVASIDSKVAMPAFSVSEGVHPAFDSQAIERSSLQYANTHQSVRDTVVSTPSTTPVENSVTPVSEPEKPIVTLKKDVAGVQNIPPSDSKIASEEVPIPVSSVSEAAHPAFDNTTVERNSHQYPITDHSVRRAVAPSIPQKSVDAGAGSNTFNVYPALIGSAGVASSVLGAAAVSAATEAETSSSSVEQNPVTVESVPSHVEGEVTTERTVGAFDHEQKVMSASNTHVEAKSSDAGSSVVENNTVINVEPAIGKPIVSSIIPDRVELTGDHAEVDVKVPPAESFSKSVSQEVPLSKSASPVQTRLSCVW
ncbi:unnamed protein product [Ambrosiozyma monospora]|uniref:Unnamed protein product n=1 Tax=Ambrosiozyma monospora TaxID=43982 RepID=A0A9W6Z0P4_AMBMO|nr:unnamed protein product [Ambrosiozyma monospora]